MMRRPILAAPGVFDALSARAAEAAGFEAIFLSGAGLAAASLARPDVGVVTMSETVEAAVRIADRVAIPLLVDIDQGFGSFADVRRAIGAFARAGAAGVQLEDQTPVKPADALLSRPLISVAEMCGKLAAALDARANPRMIISARTDAALSEGVEAAIGRALAYVETGADAVFVEGLPDPEACRALAEAIGSRAPLVYNSLPGGKAPALSAAEAEARGFGLVLFPAAAIGPAASAMTAALATLKETGANAAADASLAKLIDAAPYLAAIARFAPKPDNQP
jgi:2-methylisocitrate lyase-like PEP mutase family enzyme